MKRKTMFLCALLFVVLAGLPLACSSLSSSEQELDRQNRIEPWEVDDEDDPAGDDVTDPGDPTGPSEEVCDGRDNDADGSTDEDLDGAACETAAGEEGFTACIAGVLRCRVCEPGTTREASCGCGITRLDICGDDGIWRKGSCDPCGEPEPIPCGFCGTLDPSGVCVNPGSCQPGDVMYRRCDECPQSTGCGPATCVGEEWHCNTECTWELVEGCEIRPRECERDARLIEPCGQCGLQVLTCDGCFWNRGNCAEQGQCFPGTSLPVPCFDKSCREGWGATMTCNTDCEWSVSDCLGCNPGVHTEMVDCVYRHPRCGKRELQYECVITQAATDCLPGVGTKMNFTYLTDCPPIDCYPGQQESQTCTLASGAGGVSTRTCTNACTWPEGWEPCESSTSSCIPGTQEIEETDCGCGVSYLTTRTCRDDGLGWDVEITGQEDCPPCEEGDSYTTSCMVDGLCGSQSVRCNDECEWAESACNPNPGACVNGSTETRSCSHMCGSGSGTYTCIGCNWYLTGECVPDQTPECTPGETRTVQCNPEGCPQRQDSCSSNCSWVEGNCPPCG